MKNKTQPESYWNILVKTGLALIVAVLISATAHSQSAPQAAAKEFTRLVNLSTALKKIPVAENEQRASHRALVKRNNKDIVYSEPAGMWFVRSDRFWDLHKKYSMLPLADQIAWTAAENPLPGECEGYLPCHFSSTRMTYGEYLSRYPNGKYARMALSKLIESLTYLSDDAVRKDKNYEGPVEESERIAFSKELQEMRSILSRVTRPEAAKAISQLKVIEDGFK